MAFLQLHLEIGTNIMIHHDMSMSNTEKSGSVLSAGLAGGSAVEARQLVEQAMKFL